MKNDDTAGLSGAGARRLRCLVESPAQLLNVLEWAHHEQLLVVPATQTQPAVSCIVLAPRVETSRRQLRAMSVLARAAGMPVTWHEPRLGGAATARTVRALTTQLSGVDRLVVGDPFSGVTQVVVSIARTADVVIVDDGTSTLEFARQWRTGEHLTRWHQVAATPRQRRQVAGFARDQLAGSFRRRLGSGTGGGVALFSCLEVDLPDVAVTRNDYAWLRNRYLEPSVKETGDLVGTSLVETGVVTTEAYVQAVSVLARRHGIDRYFAHRKEAAAKLERIAGLGLQVVQPDLPLEVVLRAGPVGRRVVSFPSTVVHTLPLVLAGVDVELLVCDIDDHWYSPDAPVRSSSFLGDVSDLARQRFGLARAAG